MNVCLLKAFLNLIVELKDNMTWLNIPLTYCSQEDDLFIFTHAAFVHSSSIFLNQMYFSPLIVMNMATDRK